MAKQIKTFININASPKVVWNILTDFEKYPEWNPFITSISGDVKVGNRIKIRIQDMVFKPKILIFDKNKQLKWLGHLGIKGFFDGEHKFLLTENSDGSTHFEHSEKFSGILVPLFWKKLNTETRRGFEKMNKKLKEIAESQ
ncbi:SRPBCC domain-containing protein [Aureibaculum sp. 2210JD6-5]|uniref:SRPBCC domain-containing protein n=1 Tax=Aureibaculum sp. 2210JD6-5 TaxID=3103957 RepID=UPI002AADEADE|nr:SRPBCC domain-containing protein [Aureibaculum sp. 2210JD6-5]MDY7396123.1 SRPBCC domain-containing protein [Aureibaculum sp. 2210JD6-5]